MLLIMSTNILFGIFVVIVLRQGLNIQPWLDYNLQSSYLSLWNVGITWACRFALPKKCICFLLDIALGPCI
jgi:hypothetical protein